MTLAKTLLAALAALALAACGGGPPGLRGAAEQRAPVAHEAPAGGQTGQLSDFAEPRPAALSGFAEPRPAALSGFAEPGGLSGAARPVSIRP